MVLRAGLAAAAAADAIAQTRFCYDVQASAFAAAREPQILQFLTLFRKFIFTHFTSPRLTSLNLIGKN